MFNLILLQSALFMKVQVAFYFINIILSASKYFKIYTLLRFEVHPNGLQISPFTSITLLFCFKINKTLNTLKTLFPLLSVACLYKDNKLACTSPVRKSQPADVVTAGG